MVQGQPMGRDNNARIRSLRIEIDGANAHVQSKITSKNSQKLYKNTSPMKWKYISSLKTRIYPKRFPNASAVIWSLVLQTINLANNIEEF
jgi:hypothetical protein